MSQPRPFTIAIPDEALADLAQRLRATRWIEDCFEGDWKFGAPTPWVRDLCRHWLEDFDWRALEARLNREEHRLSDHDGVTIHSMSRRSARADAVPVMLLHGWPSSFLEFTEMFDALTAPPAGEPAFHAVAPSLPGYGFSSVRPGLTPQAIAPLLVAHMRALGHERFMVQGGDWGFLVGTEVARQFPENVIGLHLNLVNGSAPADAASIPLDDAEQAWAADATTYLSEPHLVLHTRQPASIAHAMNDSPAGLAAWIGEKVHNWIDGEGLAEPFVPFDRLLANIALYWFTGTVGSAARLYWEMWHDPPHERPVTVPTAAAIFPKEVVKLPRAWAERHFNIVQWTVHPRGGHFPALEQPEVLVDDMRRFARLLASD